VRDFLRNKRAMTGLSILVFFGLVAIFAGVLSPYNPNNFNFAPDLPPSGTHLLGTTIQNQDLLSQLIYGSRETLIVGLVTGALVAIVQLVMGVFAGYAGGAMDSGLTFITNVFLVLPSLPFLIVLQAYTQSKSSTTVIIVLTVTGWAWGARVLRSQAIALRDRPFIEAARMSGEKRWRIVVFNVLPNMFGILVANFFGAALYAVLAYSFLQFLGLGNSNEISWGSMLFWAQNGQADLFHDWIFLFVPGACILMLGMALGLLNFAVDEVADPRLRRN
jgi:peptide/nickel transport system permease protein